MEEISVYPRPARDRSLRRSSARSQVTRLGCVHARVRKQSKWKE